MSIVPKLTVEGINNGFPHVIITGKAPGYSFANGKRLSETPTHWKINVALQGNCLTPLTVKVEGSGDPLPDVTPERIEEACRQMKPLFVRFLDCAISVYAIDGLKMSATASGVELVNLSK